MSTRVVLVYLPAPKGSKGFLGAGCQIQYHPSGSPVRVGLFADSERARKFIASKGWQEVKAA